MNSTIFESWPLITLLAIEAAVVVGLAFLLQFFIQSAFWRRNLWQTCLLTLLFLVFVEISGAGRVLASWPAAKWFQQDRPLHFPSAANSGETTVTPINFEPKREGAPASNSYVSPGELPLSPTRMEERAGESRTTIASTDTLEPGAEEISIPATAMPPPISIPPKENLSLESSVNPAPLNPQTQTTAASPIAIAGETPHSPSQWPHWIWFAGALLLLTRAWCGRLLHFLIRFRSVPVQDSDLLQTAQKLARQLGLRRSVRLIQSPRFSTPFAFGLLRPTVGLPANFTEKFPGPQQEVILAHELAHLAAHDPAWDLVADSALALFWWHPLAWWARAQFRKATESAADEASLLISNGPALLAECLVELGARLVPNRSLGSISMAGFRSGLGRRVERLLKLDQQSWSPPAPFSSTLVKLLLPFGVTAIALLSTAWTIPQTLNTGEENMNPIKTYEEFTGLKKNFWKTTLTALGLAAALPVETAAQPENSRDLRLTVITNSAPVQVAQQAPERPAEINRYSGPRRANDPYGRGPAAEPDIESKLRQIHLQQVRYDGVPLGEVLRDLQNVSRELDPEGRGINFIISNFSKAPAGTDPFSAAPLSEAQRAPINLNDVLVRVDLPLKNISLENLLNVLTRTAEHPIHYTVEDYGVVFAYGRAPEPDQKLEEQIQQLQAWPERSPYMMDPVMARRYGLPLFQAPTLPKEDGLSSKLNLIRFDEVLYDGLPLSEVVRDLIEQSRVRDPEGEGVNFIFSPLTVHELPPPQFDPFTGTPLPAPPAIDLRDTIILLTPPLRNVRLKDVLDAITKVAERPIEYSIEEYAVIFNPGAQAYQPPHLFIEAPLQVRTFRVEPGKFLPGLEKAFGVSLGPDPDSDQVQKALRELLSKLGLDMDAKSVFYNDLTGIVLVRAAPGDWPVIEAAFETLGGEQKRAGR